MEENSFLDLINKKKNCLKSQTTIVTSTSGHKYMEKMVGGGELEVTKLEETSFGFVVDEKPDLQVAEILPFILLSSQDVVQSSNLLKEHGVTHILNIGTEIPLNNNLSTLVYKKIQLLDVPEADFLNVLEQCFEFIDHAKKENHSNKILVHCNAGYSRSPSIIIAYLMKSYRIGLDKALQMVKEKRNVCPNAGFMQQLKQYEAQLQL